MYLGDVMFCKAMFFTTDGMRNTEPTSDQGPHLQKLYCLTLWVSSFFSSNAIHLIQFFLSSSSLFVIVAFLKP